MNEQVRSISQCDETGQIEYGSSYQEDNRGRALTPTQSDIDIARRIKEMNGSRGWSMGFTKFYVTILYYRFEGMSDDGENSGEQKEQWAFLRGSESVEIMGV